MLRTYCARYWTGQLGVTMLFGLQELAGEASWQPVIA